MDPPWRNHWCPRWRSCGLLRERRQPEHHQPCTRLKSITIHLVSPTTIACETQERKKERKEERKREMCECGPWMICIMFLRGTADKGEKGQFRPCGFFPKNTKPYPAGPSTSRTTIIVIIVFQAKVQKLRDDVRILELKNFYVILND